MNTRTIVKINLQDQNRQWSKMLRKPQRRLTLVKHILKNHHQLSEQNLRTSANNKAKQGDYQGAIAQFTQLIELNPNSAIDYNNRGLMYFRSGQKQEALADYNQALQLNPNLDSAYNNRANYYVSIGQTAKALEDYEQALDLNPANTRTWINQAITLRELGLYNLAIENLDLALVLGCLEGHIYAERGRAYHLRGDWNCAIFDYQQALAQLPRSDASGRLRQKVETWMFQLLEPLRA